MQTKDWVILLGDGITYSTVRANHRPPSAVCEVPAEWSPGDDKYLIISDVTIDGVTTKVAQLNVAQKTADAQAKAAQEAAEASAKAVKAAVKASISFGNQLIEDFAVENVLLGISQDGMTGTVLDKMSKVSEALRSGSLYEAMDRIRAMPAEDKDPKYITDIRLLAAVNKIEIFLGLEPSLSL